MEQTHFTKKDVVKLYNNINDLYDDMSKFCVYYKHLNECLKELGPTPEHIYIDVGCGTGNFLSLNEKYYFIGLDSCFNSLKRASKKLVNENNSNINLVCGDAENLPFKDNSIDGAISVNMLYQLPNPLSFCNEVNRVLKSDGKCIVSTPKSKKTLKSLGHILLEIIRKPHIVSKVSSLKKIKKAHYKIFKDKVYLPQNEIKKLFENSNLYIEKFDKDYFGKNWIVVTRKARVQKIK